MVASTDDLRREPPETEWLAIETDDLPASPAMDRAIDVLRAEQPLVFPTDTVYGVGCDMWSELAIARLYEAKKRPLSMPIPVLVSGIEHVGAVALQIPAAFDTLVSRFWPGGLTLVVRRRPEVPAILCSGGDTIALRMPDNAIALALVERMGGALATTSANLSGQPAPTTAAEAGASLGGRVPLILDGGRCPGGQASTLLDLVATPPRVLRVGGVSVETLRMHLPELSSL